MIRTLIRTILRRLAYWMTARQQAADWRTDAQQIAHVRTWD